ncbi:MAG: neutral zinc metallopeptidase [Ardenticatenales bacterium]|nr:neutral zinc metallopeptidase [Ardenticatenales bacterium]
MQAANETCRFFTEGSGQAEGATVGYSVCDDNQAGFLSAFNRWGLQKIGYPISRRYERDGFVTQAFQKAIMQWRVDSGTVVLVNIFDDMSRLGLDQQLLETHQTPRTLPAGWDGTGLSFEQIVQKRQGLLASRPALRAAYMAAGDPLIFFGLPTSTVTDMGNHYAIRLQRAVLQEWKEDVPWARRGQVTIANGGTIARERRVIPEMALIPEGGSSAAANPPLDSISGNPAPPVQSNSQPPASFDATVRDIDAFWQAHLAQNSHSYRAPKVITYGSEGVQTPCGFVDGGTAAYCAGAKTIYYDASFLTSLQQQSGALTPRIVLAHEWGHHIQNELQLIQPSSLEREIQADCLAGVFASAGGQHAMSAEEQNEAASLFALAGDEEALPQDNPFAHGSSAQRQAAFTAGVQKGLPSCIAGN